MRQVSLMKYSKKSKNEILVNIFGVYTLVTKLGCFIFVEISSSSSTTTIKKWAPTRWDSRWVSIHSIIENYNVLNESFEELIDEGSERSVDARGLLLAIKQPIFVVTMFILDRLCGKIKILSDQLKCKVFPRKFVVFSVFTLSSIESFLHIYSS